MKIYFMKHLIMFICIIVMMGCTTDDVLPSLVAFEPESNSLSEADGSVTINASLNAPASSATTIFIEIVGTAIFNVDYSLSADELIIPQGDMSGDIIVNGIQDNELEGIETIILIVSIVQNANLVSSFELTIDLLDDDADSDNDGVVDANDECVNLPGEASNNGCPFLGFLINEVLYDPASGDDGDSNGDGTRSASEDEFVEFINSGDELDISGYEVFDAEALANNTPRHTFPTGTVVPRNGAILLFGGGSPAGNFGGSIVQTANGFDGQLNLNNSGDLLTIRDAAGNTILTFDVEPLSDNPDESFSRNPDLMGEFEQHGTIAESNGALFSPGVRIDGSSF